METTKKCRRSLLCLPTHVIQEIILRLPLKSLASCKGICKQLLAMVSDPEFVDLHLSRSRPHLLYRYSPFLSNPYQHFRYTLHPDGPFSLSLLDLLSDEAVTNLAAPWYSPKVSLTNSCKGLLCFYTRPRHLAVCNPILGEIMSLPELANCSHVSRVAIGFGAKQKQFKVLCVVSHNRGGGAYKKYEAWMYVIGEATTSWRSIGPAPFHLSDSSKLEFGRWNMDTFVNGLVHWFDQDHQMSPMIRAFDFDTERFTVVPLSEKMDIDPDLGMQVGIFEGCLVVSGLASVRRQKVLPAEVWIMKEYGVKESWTKLYTVDDFSPIPLPCPIVRLVKILGDSGKKALVINNTDLVSYDGKSMQPHRLESLPFMHFRPLEIPVVSLVPSLVSLRRIANRENIDLY